MESSAKVYIGVYLARLEMPWAKSLKEKRSLVLPLTEKLKVRFPVSVARLAGLNRHDWELIGVSAISSDAVWLEGLLNRVGEFMASQGTFRVAENSLELELWDSLEERYLLGEPKS